MKKTKSLFLVFVKNHMRLLLALKLSIMIVVISTSSANAQDSFSVPPDSPLKGKTTITAPQPLKEIRGTVKDPQGQPLFGATVMVKGTTTGIITDVNGNFVLMVPENAQTLVVSFVGMASQEIPIANKTIFAVSLAEEAIGIGEVVVVGYGQQKRESIVGAITNTTNEALERRGGVANLGSALSGQLPGVTIMERTGEPGKEDPLILIRGQSTWNGASPLILVDGVERRMNDINVHEVQSVSVLKDASATAVFGVKGANGVILITTKRGELGKAKLSMTANYGIKDVSRIFTLAEAFTAQNWKNAAIEHEVASNEIAWQYYLPYEQVLRSKRPQQYPYLYPNVDWPSEVLKDYANNAQVNLNVSGGTQFAKYFASIAYSNEDDILKSFDNPKGYNGGFTYNRLNFRGNLDFELTKTTKLSTNVSGYTGIKKDNLAYGQNWMFQSLYQLPPDAFPVRYEDGTYGKDPTDQNLHNPIAIINETGVEKNNRLFIGTDFKLEQRLDFLTQGLSVNANVSYDNYFGYSGPNISDVGNQGQTMYKYVDPKILDAKNHSDSLNAVTLMYSAGATAINEYDFVLRPWTVSAPSVNNGSIQRTLFYQFSFNYARSFEKHDVSGLALVNRRKAAEGAEFPNYREDWVGRVTYAYANKYFAEVNGAYNGSEKFGPGYRFGFFPSVALGWMLSNENFLKYDWLYKLKIRGSIGKVGSDAGIPRWGYVPSWTVGGTNKYNMTYANALFGNATGTTSNLGAMASPYTFYWEGTIPNMDLNWETAIKKNIGFELSLFENMITVEADFFKDNREGIFMNANRRNIPMYFGAAAVPLNLGKTETKGIEVDIMFRRQLDNGFNYWFRESFTRAKDIVLKAEDPPLQDDYLNTVGFQIGQTKTQIRDGSITTNWDEVYGQTGGDSNIRKLPGDWGIIDFNGDGKINTFDNAPYGFPSDRPANTYSTFLGAGYKNFSMMVQFYGVTNITQYVDLMGPAAGRKSRVQTQLVDYWTKDNPDATYMAPRLTTGSGTGDFPRFDGSFLRLKTVELSYKLPTSIISKLGLSTMRFYANGNNLFFWSDLPMDNESGGFDVYNSYPTFRVVNFGVDVAF